MNTHYYEEKATGLSVACSIDYCEICGEDTIMPGSQEDVSPLDVQEFGLQPLSSELKEGVETPFGYLCQSCKLRV